MLEKIKLTNNLDISPLIHGHWRLSDWNMSKRELIHFSQELVDIGVTTFDHADIYGDYSCEKLFGNALGLEKGLRSKIQIITKCGIKLVSNKYPERTFNTYDYSFEHILESVDNSLKNLNTEYIDVLLLHRPSPLLNPEEVAKAFTQLKESGKVLHFGVSNFLPSQFEMLNSYLADDLVTNQVEISPLNLEHFTNGNLDFFQKNKLKPLAWSPLSGGRILAPKSAKEQRIYNSLQEVAQELNVNSIDIVIYSWLLKHPSNIIPIIGSGKLSRIKNAVEALKIKMTDEQWFKIYIASIGEALP